MTAPQIVSDTPAAKPQRVASISYASLGAHALSFLIGILAVLLGQNFAHGDSTTFTTASLISFLFGIALSAASTVLAIAAISLGKSSEHAMVERSDASIRLQNEVFTRTTEALARIESSTGVTEKRIEDIISGRAGELSHAIAERLGASGSTKGKTRETIEQEIKESLIGQLTDSRVLTMRETAADRKKREEDQARYRSFQNDLLIAVASSQVGKCLKVGEGQFSGKGSELFDAVVTVNNEHIGVSAFGARHIGNLRGFVQSAVEEVASERFQRIFIVFDRVAAPDGKTRAILHETLAPMKTELAERIELIDGPDGSAIAKVVERLRNLALMAAGPNLHIASQSGDQPAERAAGD